MAVTHFLLSFVTDIVTDASFTENNEKMRGIRVFWMMIMPLIIHLKICSILVRLKVVHAHVAPVQIWSEVSPKALMTTDANPRYFEGDEVHPMPSEDSQR